MKPAGRSSKADLVFRSNEWVLWRHAMGTFRDEHAESVRRQVQRQQAETDALIRQVVCVLAEALAPAPQAVPVLEPIPLMAWRRVQADLLGVSVRTIYRREEQLRARSQENPGGIMGRFEDWDDCGDVVPEGLWEYRLKRALEGRRGQKALREIRDALMALPGHRLIEGALCTVGAQARGEDFHSMYQAEIAASVEQQGEGVCLIGAYAWWKKVQAGADPQQAFDDLPTLLDTQTGPWDTARVGQQAGLVWTLAWHLAQRNDDWYRDLTPEQRWEKFIAWIDEQITDEQAVASA